MSNAVDSNDAEFAIGIDPGTQNWRVARTDGPNPVPVDIGCGIDGHGALRHSWKSRLGEDDSAAIEFVTRRFRDIARMLGGNPAPVAVSVPAWFTSRHRTNLRACAAVAGLPGVILVADGVAATAAVFQSHLMALVVCLGHHGCETSLIRCADHRLEVLAIRSNPDFSGQAINQLVNNSLRAGLDAHRDLDLLSRSPNLFAALVEESNGLLLTREAVHVDVHEPDRAPLRLSIRRSDLDFQLRRIIDDMMADVDTTLSETGADGRLPDAVLLFGAPAAMPRMRERMNLRFGERVRRLHDWAAAFGAARLALGEPIPPPAPESDTWSAMPVEQSRILASGLEGEVVVEQERIIVRLRASSSRIGDRSAPAAFGRVEDDNQDQGPAAPSVSKHAPTARQSTARAYQPPDHSVSAALARRSLRKARKLLAAGESENAVRETHRAFEDIRGPGEISEETKSEVLEEMISVHIDAALAANTPKSYEDSLRWLNCANGHYPSNNTRVYRALADRHALHARQMLAAAQYDEAATAAAEALRFAPQSDEILGLLKQAETGNQRS